MELTGNVSGRCVHEDLPLPLVHFAIVSIVFGPPAKRLLYFTLRAAPLTHSHICTNLVSLHLTEHPKFQRSRCAVAVILCAGIGVSYHASALG